MDVNRGRNCYSRREFGHVTQNCRNWRMVGQGQRLEYGGNGQSSNLNRDENLIVLN